MGKRQILNIINFIRGVEPRCDMDLVSPVKNQIALIKKNSLKGTFLLQYDAMCDERFVGLLRGLDTAQFEVGVWLETVQPLVEKAGIRWRGRYAWDWHSDVGFTVGYPPAEREKMVDILFEDFRNIFGYYPRVMGSWAFDAHTLSYAENKYGLDAACNCKDQWGTDGYTLWGGYYSGAYYPSRFNSYMPAQNAENQINVPVFRMLGSDPVYQYDLGLDPELQTAAGVQGVITLEPVYSGDSGGGGEKKWVDWFLKENYNTGCLSLAYAQAGQENSFGWEAMKTGLNYQFEMFRRMSLNGNLEVETLGESGRKFKADYHETPAAAVSAESDWKDSGRKSYWYNCKNYRANIYCENGRFWVRDIHIFDERVRERYLDKTCSGNRMTYDTLPVTDGNLFSGNKIRAGIYPFSAEGAIGYKTVQYSENVDTAIIEFNGESGGVHISLSPEGITVDSDIAGVYYESIYDSQSSQLTFAGCDGKILNFSHNGYNYSAGIDCGEYSEHKLYPRSGKLKIKLRQEELK